MSSAVARRMRAAVGLKRVASAGMVWRLATDSIAANRCHVYLSGIDQIALRRISCRQALIGRQRDLGRPKHRDEEVGVFRKRPQVPGGQQQLGRETGSGRVVEKLG